MTAVVTGAARGESLLSYSGLREARPSALVHTRDVLTIATTLHRAEQEGRRVTVRAAGRSFDDQAMNDDVVIDVSTMNRILALDPIARTITVEPAATWIDITKATLACGLIPHILVTTPWATAGGTLSANCISRSTARYGHTGDHVLSFLLLTVGGECMRCSRSENADVFRAVIGGFGYFGVVVEITFDLMHVGPRVRVRTEIDRREGLAPFVEHLTSVSASPGDADGVYSVFSLADPLRGAVFRSRYTDEPGSNTLFLHRPHAWYRAFGELLFASSTIGNFVCHASYEHVFGRGPFVDDLFGYTFCMEGNERMRAMAARAGVRMCSLQPSFAVPPESTTAFLEDTARLFRKFDVYPSLLDMLLLPEDDFLLSSAFRMPGFCTSFVFESVTRAKHRRLEACLLEVNEACAAAGGRVHLIKSVDATGAQLRRMYAHALPELARLKSRLDPRGVLVNDFFVRAFG